MEIDPKQQKVQGEASTGIGIGVLVVRHLQSTSRSSAQNKHWTSVRGDRQAVAHTETEAPWTRLQSWPESGKATALPALLLLERRYDVFSVPGERGPPRG